MGQGQTSKAAAPGSSRAGEGHEAKVGVQAMSANAKSMIPKLNLSRVVESQAGRTTPRGSPGSARSTCASTRTPSTPPQTARSNRSSLRTSPQADQQQAVGRSPREVTQLRRVPTKDSTTTSSSAGAAPAVQRGRSPIPERQDPTPGSSVWASRRSVSATRSRSDSRDPPLGLNTSPRSVVRVSSQGQDPLLGMNTSPRSVVRVSSQGQEKERTQSQPPSGTPVALRSSSSGSWKVAKSTGPPLTGSEKAAREAVLIAQRTKRWSLELLDHDPLSLQRARSDSLPNIASRASSPPTSARSAPKAGQQSQPSQSPSTTMRGRRFSGSAGAVVKLHVYDASWLVNASIPIVHLGVEIYGCEFSFGDAGVRSFKPGSYDVARYRAMLVLGMTLMRRKEVYSLLMAMKMEFPGERYRLVGCNCQTFAQALCERLGLGACIPEEYVYFAKPFRFPLGVDLSDFLPASLLGSNCSSSSSGRGSGSGDVECMQVAEDIVEGTDKYPSALSNPASD